MSLIFLHINSFWLATTHHYSKKNAHVSLYFIVISWWKQKKHTHTPSHTHRVLSILPERPHPGYDLMLKAFSLSGLSIPGGQASSAGKRQAASLAKINSIVSPQPLHFSTPPCGLLTGCSRALHCSGRNWTCKCKYNGNQSLSGRHWTNQNVQHK